MTIICPLHNYSVYCKILKLFLKQRFVEDNVVSNFYMLTSPKSSSNRIKYLKRSLYCITTFCLICSSQNYAIIFKKYLIRNCGTKYSMQLIIFNSFVGHFFLDLSGLFTLVKVIHFFHVLPENHFSPQLLLPS